MADPYGIITNVLVPNGVTVYQNIIVNVTFLSNIRLNKYNMVNETELLQQVKLFKEDALIEVYDRYSPELYRYAMRLLGDENAAEECVSETFSRFLNAVKSGKGPENYLRAYLYRIAHNWITDNFRRQTPNISIDTQTIVTHSDNPCEEAIKKIEVENIRSSLKRLTADQRQVIALRFLEDWTIEQIAQVMEKPPGAIKALQHRALHALRRLIEGEEP